MSTILNADYWSQRYHDGRTGWDIGHASEALLTLATRFDKTARILIPGCGNAWEAEALWKLGYTRVYIADWSIEPLQAFQARVPDFPAEQLLCADFFALESGYDLILEQTFFCALPPERRDAYVLQMHRLLKTKGVLGGLLFDFPLTEDGPPFGGSQAEYTSRFLPWFTVVTMERAAQSIAPRAGRELYFELEKKA